MDLFQPSTQFTQDSWAEYGENHFGQRIDSLMEEWKQGIKKGNIKSFFSQITFLFVLLLVEIFFECYFNPND